MAAPLHVLLVLAAVVLYRYYFSAPLPFTYPTYPTSTPTFSDFLTYENMVKYLYTQPPVVTKIAGEPPLRAPTVYVPDYVDLARVQKCLEDRRSDFVTVNSTTFSGERELEKRPYQGFFVLERDHFTLFSHFHSSVKFSYKSRNAVMSLLWRSSPFSDISTTKFVEVDGLWQLEQLPVLCFVFGRDADALQSSYLIDDNTISKYLESTTTIAMAELAKLAQAKADLCVSHFFVVNRGKEYWAVDTKDPSVSYAFGPSTKTRTISRLADGSITVQALIDEEPSQTIIKTHASRNSEFKLCDINGEEVVEGDRFVLHIPGRGDDDDPEEERRTMFDGKDWIGVFNRTGRWDGEQTVVHGATDNGAVFGITVIDGATYLTFEDQFLQIGSKDFGLTAIVLPDVPFEHSCIQIGYSDDGDVVLSQWGTGLPIVCDWVKYAYGAIYAHDLSDAIHTRMLLKLHFIADRLQPDLQQVLGLRDAIYNRMSEYLKLKTHIETIRKQGLEELETRVDLGSDFY
ncbi:hypothetical protein GGI09_005376, partial [Coemansia sp. S100]